MKCAWLINKFINSVCEETAPRTGANCQGDVEISFEDIEKYKHLIKKKELNGTKI